MYHLLVVKLTQTFYILLMIMLYHLLLIKLTQTFCVQVNPLNFIKDPVHKLSFYREVQTLDPKFRTPSQLAAELTRTRTYDSEVEAARSTAFHRGMLEDSLLIDEEGHLAFKILHEPDLYHQQSKTHAVYTFIPKDELRDACGDEMAGSSNIKYFGGAMSKGVIRGFQGLRTMDPFSFGNKLLMHRMSFLFPSEGENDLVPNVWQDSPQKGLRQMKEAIKETECNGGSLGVFMAAEVLEQQGARGLIKNCLGMCRVLAVVVTQADVRMVSPEPLTVSRLIASAESLSLEEFIGDLLLHSAKFEAARDFVLYLDKEDVINILANETPISILGGSMKRLFGTMKEKNIDRLNWPLFVNDVVSRSSIHFQQQRIFLALCMGMHPRLGEGSWIATLLKDNLICIWEHCWYLSLQEEPIRRYFIP